MSEELGGRRVGILHGKHVTLGVTGSIAAYKAVGLASALHQAGAVVDVAMTPDAQRFLQPLSFQAITHRPVFADLWAPGIETDIAHVTLGQRSQVIVIAPATANILAKLAHGLADDPVSVTALAARCPIIVAPAMDAGMFSHPATVSNVELLKARGVVVVEPESGHLASGLLGLGRLAAPETILDFVRATLGAGGDLAGRRVLVTAGGTREPIDPVRFIGNHSSGKMGYAIAEAARDRGARVLLVSAPTAIRAPAGLRVVQVNSAQEMLSVLHGEYSSHDALIMAAAVADFNVGPPADHKIKRGEHELELRLLPNPDLLAATALLEIANKHPIRVGFAAETQDMIEHAADKLERKSLDLIVANDVLSDVFGADTNEVTLVWSDGRRVELPRMPKPAVAEHVLDAVAALLAARARTTLSTAKQQQR
ncbi:MAG: bifunctional phosphopantothenoylcysteine decarboxylase/phosphopantothenate--cysteine ligase CoaBC [Chloroflexota bacterium]|nr:bifunctional phosphopantothenoylcysteine decarboxylase/phosphopantothenate--cysteine ligase CoaBC [Chloroflexota bacterium]